MRIGELAHASGVTASRIRFYEKVGLLPPPSRQMNGYREYARDAAALISLVERAQGLGFSLREITGFLGKPLNPSLSCSALLDRLSVKLVETDWLLAEVRRRRREIVTLMRELRSNELHSPAGVLMTGH